MVWTAELAYVVGLLVADGNLSKDGRHINLRSCDIDLMQTFKRCLHLDVKIGQSESKWSKKPCYRVQFGNVKLYKWLLEMGLSPAKTYTVGAIKVPDQFFPDFLRGHLDGDGSLTTYFDNYEIYKERTYNNYRVILRFISVSPTHIFWLRKQISKLTNLKGSLIQRLHKNPKYVPMWTLKFSKKESIKLIQWMYYKEGLPALERKAKHAKEVLEYVAQEERKTWTRVEDTPLLSYT